MRDLFICLKDTDITPNNLAILLSQFSNSSTVAVSGDIEVLTDWISDKPYEDKKRPDTDWSCISLCNS